MDSIQSRLEQGEIIVLDGGISSEIERRGVEMSYGTWSGTAISTHPDVITGVHEDYIKAGADIITTNTYCGTRVILRRDGLGDRTEEINRRAVEYAQKSRERAARERSMWIAGSMSCDVEKFLNDELSDDEAGAAFQEQATVLAKAGVDLLLTECIIGMGHTRKAVEAALATGLPVWASLNFGPESERDRWSKPPGKLYTGETPAEAAKILVNLGVSAILIFHTRPTDVAVPLQQIKDACSLPVGVYAHSGEWFRPYFNTVGSLSPYEYLQWAQDWVSMGAQIIGGCCGTTPEHIGVLKAKLPAKGPR